MESNPLNHQNIAKFSPEQEFPYISALKIQLKMQYFSLLNFRKNFKINWIKFKIHQVLSLDPKRLENDLRMAVAHTDSNYAPKQVQISLSIWIPEPLHMTLTNHNWILVISQKSRGQVGLSDLHGLFIGDSLQIANT